MNDMLNEIEKLRNELKSLRPLNKTELRRLREEFTIETTYRVTRYEI